MHHATQLPPSQLFIYDKNFFFQTIIFSNQVSNQVSLPSAIPVSGDLSVSANFRASPTVWMSDSSKVMGSSWAVIPATRSSTATSRVPRVVYARSSDVRWEGSYDVVVESRRLEIAL